MSIIQALVFMVIGYRISLCRQVLGVLYFCLYKMLCMPHWRQIREVNFKLHGAPPPPLSHN